MKKMKKLASLLLAMIMVFAMSATAFAAEADLSGHTYNAYQIFEGTQAENESALGEIDWGDGVDGEKLLIELKKNTAFANCTSAEAVAEVLATYGDKSEGAEAFAKVAYKFIIEGKGKNIGDSLEAGYYLVVDETTFEDGATNTAVNLALLQLTKKGQFTIENKTDVPEVVKKVKDTNDTAGTTTDWQDSADYDIGDEVPFQLTATLASNVTDYDTYKVVFHDTLSAGLDYKEGSVVVKMGNQDVTSYFTPTESNGTLTISCENVKKFGATNSSVIVVEYIAFLDTDAVIGSAGNPNTVYLEYSNNPNWNGEGTPTGKTPTDKVIVFTYKLDVNKVDENQNPLAGAEFKLEKFVNGAWVEVVNKLTLDTTGTIFTFTGLDDGQYKLTETKAPNGYNIGSPLEFVITAEHNVTADEPTLISLTGDKVTGTASTGTLLTTVINQKGATLPETGGMGTTLFYVAGFAMMITAAGAFVARRRMTF